MTTKKAAKRKPAKAARRPVVDEAAMMAAWQKAMTPGDGHRRLEPIVGTFKAKTTMVMEPGQPPQVSEGTSVHRWALGGRYVEQRYSGTSMGMPFEGLGYTGYDNVQKKYVGTWMDSFGTGFMHSLGVGRPKSDAMDFEAESFCPTGERMKFQSKLRIPDRNRHSFEMWTKAPNGKRYRMMIIEYTRA